MWVVSLVAAVVLLVYVGQVGWLLWKAIRTPVGRSGGARPELDGAQATDPPPSPRRSPILLAAALLFALAAVVLELFAMYADMQPSKYELAWILALPAAGALLGIAQALVLMSTPKAVRSPAAESFVWLLAVCVLGVGACYGTMILG